MSKKPEIKPSELIFLAIHNLDREYGASEKEIVKFISSKLKMKPGDVKTRVKPALTRSVALQLVTHTPDGKFKLYDMARRKPHKTKSESNIAAAKKINIHNVKNVEPVVYKHRTGWGSYKKPAKKAPLDLIGFPETRCKSCGRRKFLIKNQNAKKLPYHSSGTKANWCRPKTEWW